jgi:uncharacterized phage protein (TIGR01671 family)
MRKISFRVWNKKDKEMSVMHILLEEVPSTGISLLDLILLKTNWWEMRNSDGVFEDYSYTDFELLQDTGLKDKNGKEIYEGYITKTKFRKELCIVEYLRGTFWVNNLPLYEFGNVIIEEDNDTIRTLDLEVIGNIFETEELLNEIKN